MKPPDDLPSFLQDDDIWPYTLLDVTMNDGSRFTAMYGDISENWQRMEWRIVTNEAERKRPKRTIIVQIRGIASAVPAEQPNSEPILPASAESLENEPLNPSTFTLQSGILFAIGIPAVIAVSYFRDWWWPAHWQVVALALYTIAVLVGTFASIRVGSVLPEIPLAAPHVRTRLPRLAAIHIVCLAAFLVVLAFAIAVQPSAPGWVNAKVFRGATFLEIAVGIALYAMLNRQVSFNRRLLETV